MSVESLMEHVVSVSDWDDFVAVCYFGREGDWLDRCMRRAYLDMNRTLHGMGTRGEGHSDWTTVMVRVLRDRLTMLPGDHAWTQASFDAWHQESVSILKRISAEHGFSVSVGQSQKWINMSIKYAIALGERRVPGFLGVYDVAHVALDNIVLEHLTELGMPPLGRAWSRLDEYGQYMAVQEWVRKNFSMAPVEAEYDLWLRPRVDVGAEESRES